MEEDLISIVIPVYKVEKYLEKCEQTYFLIAKKYDFKTIECVLNDNIKSIEQISDELYEFVLRSLK